MKIKRIYHLGNIPSLYLTVLCLLCLTHTSAQDFHLSQYEAFSQHLNPAMTGMFEGHYRASVHYRNQWRSIASQAFTTQALSFDMPFEKFNGGAYILNNRAGAGNYNVLQFVISAAYDHKFKDSHNHLAMGLQLGIIHKSVNINKLFFGSQYDNSNGGSFDPGLPSEEIFSNPSIILPATNAGLLYYYSNDASSLNPFVGISAFHLTEPNETFYGVENNLPRKYLLMGGAKINFSNKFQMIPQVLTMMQTNAKEIVPGITNHYYLQGSNAYLLFGFYYRNKDAAIIHTGFAYKEFEYRFSYDLNTSALHNITRGKGGFELSVVYVMSKVNPKPVTACPRL